MRYDRDRDLVLGLRAAAEEWAESVIEISALLPDRFAGVRFEVSE